jgi:hypothetical protein
MVCFFPTRFYFLATEIVGSERKEGSRGEKKGREKVGMGSDVCGGY